MFIIGTGVGPAAVAVGRLPPVGVLAGMVPVMATSGVGTSTASPLPVLATREGSVTTSAACSNPGTYQLTPESPVSALWHETASSKAQAVVVSPNTPPVPSKIAERIWNHEFVELDTLLPASLGAPEPTLRDLVCGERKREKKISTIQEWVGCFNTFTAVVLTKEPERAKDLLAYCSLIVKASGDYEATAWLGYDRLFRRLAAAEPAVYPNWGQIQPSLWASHFSSATSRPASSGKDWSSRSERKGQYRGRPYPGPTCKRWNWGGGGCSLQQCSFRHQCATCGGDHRAKECPRYAKQELDKKRDRAGGEGGNPQQPATRCYSQEATHTPAIHASPGPYSPSPSDIKQVNLALTPFTKPTWIRSEATQMWIKDFKAERISMCSDFEAHNMLADGRYRYTGDLLALEACSGGRNDLPETSHRITTPLVASRWQAAMQAHPDRAYTGYVVAGIQQGFRVGFEHGRQGCRSVSNNMASAQQHPEPVTEYLATELQAGRIIEVPRELRPSIQISRFGVIPKTSQPGRWLDL